jgi:hypothetical protein
MIPHPRRRTVLLSVAAARGLTILPCGRATPPELDVPYVPTPQEVVAEMLELGKVGKKDTLFDLGCGDDCIVVTAAKVRGARGTGIDIDPVRIAEATGNARKAGVGDRAKFRVGDLFKTDISSATVVTLYLLPTINARLRPSYGSSSRSVRAWYRMPSTWAPNGRLPKPPRSTVA